MMQYPGFIKSIEKNDWLRPIGLIIVMAVQVYGFIPYQDKLRSYLFDSYQTLLPRERISAPVAIVDIDEESLAEFGQWPWPRSLLARLVDKLNALHPVAIGIDIILPEKDRTSPCEITQYVPGIDRNLVKKICALPNNDDVFAESLKRANVVLGMAGIDNKHEETRGIISAPMQIVGEDPYFKMRQFASALDNIPELSKAAKGHAILSTDVENGVIRRVPLIAQVGNTVLPSLSLELLRLATASPSFTVKSSATGIEGVGIDDLFIPTQPNGMTWVYYSHHDPGRFISARDIINNKISADLIESRLVLIGFSGLGLVDFPSTTIGERVPGVEVHAQMLESIFDGNLLFRPYWALWVESALILLLGLLIFYVMPSVAARIQFPLVISISALIAGGGFWVFQNNHWLMDAASPVIFFIFLYGVTLADELISEQYQIRILENNLKLQREESARARGEMEAAKRFQMGIVPDPHSVFIDEARLDISAMMEPAKMVGGDLYDCFMLDENRLFFIVGDVCGKGVPASLFMVISKTLCKSIVLRGGSSDIDLGLLLTEANMEISRDNAESLFVTAFAGILNLSNGHLSYCNAGHEKPLIVFDGCDPTPLPHTSGPPVSIIDDYQYKSYNYVMSHAESICIFTDGITEAANINEDLYGTERLTSVLSGLQDNTDSTTMLNLLVADVKTFVGEAEPSDDLTVMIVRWLNPAN